jgi:hypothetical protein
MRLSDPRGAGHRHRKRHQDPAVFTGMPRSVGRMLVIATLGLTGCFGGDPRPESITTWGEWEPQGLVVNVRALDGPFSATRCDCDIAIFVDGTALGSWQARPSDFGHTNTNGRDRVWSTIVAGSSVPRCEGEFTFALDLTARLTLADGTTFEDTRMLACPA